MIATFIKYIGIIILLLAIVFGAFNFFLKYNNNEPIHYKKQYEAITSENSDYDGMIIGTSHGTHGIRPSFLDTTGIKFFNYALNGANPEYYHHWYKIFVHPKPQKPKYCLFVLDFFLFDSYWVFRQFEQDAEYLNFTDFATLLFQNNNFNKMSMIQNRFPLLKYRLHLRNLAQKNGFDINTYDRGYIDFPQNTNSKNFEPSYYNNLSLRQLVNFKKLITMMKADGIEIFFVATPLYMLNADQYKNIKSLKLIEEIAQSNQIPFLNYNKNYHTDKFNKKAYYADWGHMSHKGAEVFSKQLALDLLPILQKK